MHYRMILPCILLCITALAASPSELVSTSVPSTVAPSAPGKPSKATTHDPVEQLFIDSYGGSIGRDASNEALTCYYRVEKTETGKYKVSLWDDSGNTKTAVYPDNNHWSLGNGGILLTYFFKTNDKEQTFKLWFEPKKHWISKTERVLRGKTTTCKFTGAES